MGDEIEAVYLSIFLQNVKSLITLFESFNGYVFFFSVLIIGWNNG